MHTANTTASSRQGQDPNYRSNRSIQWHKTLIHADNRNRLQRLIHQPSQQYQAHLHIVLLDTSGSMLSKQGLSKAKGVLQYYCESLYQKRDSLTVITFGNQQVDIIFDAKPIPKSPESILKSIKGGGGTPLNLGLKKATEVSLRYKTQPQTLLILTDGRVQTDVDLPKLSMPVTLLDMENSVISLGKVKVLSQKLGAKYLHLSQLPLMQ